jgi:hypothetical protein
MDAENPLALPLEAGQMVEMQVPAFFVLGQALAALLPPALGFGAGFGAARFLLPAAGEGTHTGIGAAALFAAAFGVYRLRKNNPPKRGYAVTCVIDPVEGPPENSNARANGTEPMVVNPGR